MATSKMNSSHSASASSMGDNAGEDSIVVRKTKSSNTADSCSWYANSACKRPRSCYDCLNTQVSDGECAIMPNGMCVSLADYANFLSQQQEFGIYYKYYSSSQYAYCSADDSMCSSCASQWVSEYKKTGNVGSPSYCTGRNGCVCLARCELPDWQNSVITDQCSGGGSAVSGERPSTASRIGFALAVGLAFGVLIGLWGIKLLFRGRRRRPTESVEYEIPIVRRPQRGPQLQLTAWNALREKLIASEQEAIGAELAMLEGMESSESNIDLPRRRSLEDGGNYHPASPMPDCTSGSR